MRKKGKQGGRIPTMSVRAIRAGKIYVLRNEDMRAFLLKVGKTARGSEERAKELSKATGVPGVFHVLFEEDVSDMDYAEKLVHERLAEYRLQPNREFFQVPYKLAIRTVLETCAEVNKDVAATITHVRILMSGGTNPKNLMDLLAPYRGGTTKVLVHYENDGASCTVSLGDAWRVNVIPILVSELQQWLGTEAVLFAKSREAI